jgi:hypothetical protein
MLVCIRIRLFGTSCISLNRLSFFVVLWTRAQYGFRGRPESRGEMRGKPYVPEDFVLCVLLSNFLGLRGAFRVFCLSKKLRSLC